MSATLDVDDYLAAGRARMSGLCNSFPTLRGVPGTSPWDHHAFAKWASGPAPSNAMRQAAAFVLSVWNGSNVDPWWNKRPYRAGIFDAALAFHLWDWEHQAAFQEWCRAPFYP